MGLPLSQAVLGLWIGISVLLFWQFPSRKATVLTYLGWLFLPCVVMIDLKGMIKIDKGASCALGIIIGTLIFDIDRVFSFRFKWYDIPVIVSCVAPFFSSYFNDLGIYDGVSASRDQFMTWGIHYFIGRLYFGDLEGLTELARGVFYAGLIYVPLCWIEIRLSPQLHYWVYGYMAHRFDQELRYDGYRPTVFLSHGLVLGMFMCLVSMLSVRFWLSKAIKKVGGMPMGYVVLIVLITTIFCKSTNAIVLGAIGLFVLSFTKKKWRFVTAILLMVPPLYCGFRGSGTWSGIEMVQLTDYMVGKDRADSVQFRLNNEDLLSEKARERPVFGWAGWDRARVYDEDGNDLTITDGMWIILFGNNGVFGLTFWLISIILPTFLFFVRFPSSTWRHPAVAAAAVFAIFFVLVAIDCLLNATAIPFIISAMGGVSGTLMPAAVARPRPVSRSRTVVTGFGFNPAYAAARGPEPIPNLVDPMAHGDPDSLVAPPKDAPAAPHPTQPKALPQ